MEKNDFSQGLESNSQDSSTNIQLGMEPFVSSSSSAFARSTEEKQEQYSKAWLIGIEEKVNKLQAEVNNMSGFTEAISDIKKSLDEAKKQQNDLKNELAEESKRHTKESIEILGVFITLFTFISVSVSIALQFNTVFHAAFILMVFLTGLMCFVYMFHHVLNHKHCPLKKLYYFNRRFSLKIFLLHHWRTGAYCFLIPFILAILLGLISLLMGPEKHSSCKTNDTANVNYIQNIPTSKIMLDKSIEPSHSSMVSPPDSNKTMR